MGEESYYPLEYRSFVTLGRGKVEIGLLNR
jgi:hypothetical protein